MKYAVIKTGGKQYRVSEGDILEVDKLEVKENTVNFENVMLLVNEETVEIGKPFLEGVRVKAKLLEQKQGEKVKVAKYKSKVRYRRVAGFRAKLSKVQIEKIETERTKPEPKKEVTKLKTTKTKKVSKKA